MYRMRLANWIMVSHTGRVRDYHRSEAPTDLQQFWRSDWRSDWLSKEWGTFASNGKKYTEPRNSPGFRHQRPWKLALWRSCLLGMLGLVMARSFS